MKYDYYSGPADAAAWAKRRLQRLNKRKLATQIVEHGRRRRQLIRICIAGVLALTGTVLLSGWDGSQAMQLALPPVVADAPSWTAASGIDAPERSR